MYLYRLQPEERTSDKDHRHEQRWIDSSAVELHWLFGRLELELDLVYDIKSVWGIWELAEFDFVNCEGLYEFAED